MSEWLYLLKPTRSDMLAEGFKPATKMKSIPSSLLIIDLTE
jgi:hypothetical protein